MKANSRKPALTATGIVLALLLALPHLLGSSYWISLFIMIGINILLASSLRLIWLTGQISLGHAGFMLVGAYTSALLVKSGGISFWLALPAGGVAAGGLALLLGYPYLRVRGIYFVILTVLTAESIRNLAFNWYGLTGGRTGLFDIPGPGELYLPLIGRVDFNLFGNYYYIVLGVAALSLLVLYLIENSRYGFTWQAIRQSGLLAATVGIDTLWFGVLNFALAAFFAGLAGSLFAHFQHTLSAWSSGSFGVQNCITLLVYMVVGGEKRFSGPAIGVLALTLVFEFTRALEAYQSILWGALGMLIVIFLPEGLVSLPQRLRTWLGRGAANAAVCGQPALVKPPEDAR